MDLIMANLEFELMGLHLGFESSGFGVQGLGFGVSGFGFSSFWDMRIVILGGCRLGPFVFMGWA